MRLDLWKVPIIKIPWILQIHVPECDNSSTFISNCQILSCLIKCYCCQDVWVCDILYVSLTKSINIDPVGVILSLVLTSTCLAFRWDFLHWTLWRLIVFSWLSCWFWHPFSSINYHFTTCSWHLLLNLLILELVHICHLWLLILGFNIARGFVIDFHKLF